MTNIYLISIEAGLLLFGCAVGCSPKPTSNQDLMVIPEKVKVKLDQIRKDYSVVISINAHQIIVGTPTVIAPTEMRRIDNDIHNAFGHEVTNYTVVHIVN